MIRSEETKQKTIKEAEYQQKPAKLARYKEKIDQNIIKLMVQRELEEKVKVFEQAKEAEVKKVV